MKVEGRDARLIQAMDAKGLPRDCLNRRALLAGVGSLGSHIAELLIRMGIREMVLCDPDRVEEKDLVQGAFGPQVGELKVEAMAGFARSIGSPTRVRPLPLRSGALGPGILHRMDLVIAALDRLEPRLDLYGAVIEAGGLAFLDAAVDGHDGRLTEIGCEGACYHCHQDLSRDEILGRAEETATGAASCRDQADPARPTIAAPYVIQQVAAVAVGRALHILAGRGRVRESRLVWNAQGSPVWRHYELSAVPGCETCRARELAARSPERAFSLEGAAAGRDSLAAIEDGARRALGPGSLEAPRLWAVFGERPPRELWSNEPAAGLGATYGARLRFRRDDGSSVCVELSGDWEWLGLDRNGGSDEGNPCHARP